MSLPCHHFTCCWTNKLKYSLLSMQHFLQLVTILVVFIFINEAVFNEGVANKDGVDVTLPRRSVSPITCLTIISVCSNHRCESLLQDEKILLDREAFNLLTSDMCQSERQTSLWHALFRQVSLTTLP